MKLLCLLVAIAAWCLPVTAQNAGANAGAGRGGGISFVTRRLPTSGVGGQSANFFAAGGRPVGPVTAGSGSVAVAAPMLAASTSPQPAITDARLFAALRKSAARGDREAQWLLQGNGPSAVATSQGTAKRRR